MTEKQKAALEQALDFIEWLTSDPLLDGDECLVEIEDVQDYARIELQSIKRKLE